MLRLLSVALLVCFGCRKTPEVVDHEKAEERIDSETARRLSTIVGWRSEVREHVEVDRGLQTE